MTNLLKHSDPKLGDLTINGHGADGSDPFVCERKKVDRAKALGLPTDYADVLREQRRQVRPPIQESLPTGSLIICDTRIYDIRIWHAGMPNHTDDPRIMLVSVIFATCYRSQNKIPLPRRWQH